MLDLRVPEDTLGYELLRLVRHKVGRASRGIPSILVGEKQLSMTQALKEQGIVSGALCLIWLPLNAFKAFRKLLNPDDIIDDGLD